LRDCLGFFLSPSFPSIGFFSLLVFFFMCIHWFFSLIWFLLVCFSYRVISFHFMFSLLLSLWFLIVFPPMFIVYVMGFSVLLLCSLEDLLPLCFYWRVIVGAWGPFLGCFSQVC
jgi:hypothetical protein